jgi:glycerophosphoryl diester phosphodiesterase
MSTTAHGNSRLTQDRLIHLIAHRGDARDYPENTLPAFAAALTQGLRFLELDVHLSADGVPMVIHDHYLKRTTGLPGTVFEHRADEVARMEAAERPRFGERFQGTCIPRLTDVLALLDGRPEVTLFVEIKRASLVQFGHDQVVARVIDTLRPWRTQCVVISFDLAAVHRARVLGGVPIGWVLPEYDEHNRLKYEALQPEFLFCDVGKLPPRTRLWRGPWRWAIYEIETLADALALAARGADYIETMAVHAMSEALRALRSAATP